ncbi:hypothetical protein IMZ31_19995 (plasmid) [Pontibacillus sp. ALD_SL1]|uniref:hypothetical protein n=1 Tax=Pontibacillus sp. ALD_SL1 TaxID=2777185 RepID=UPI001A96F0EF|nr:hypothetical protein [Pontibacillus sp. ALD_SL1]QST02834.1 hypothetical protein IMZ31_19995 [Pontibacillus sp. ALD_SL1]
MIYRAKNEITPLIMAVVITLTTISFPIVWGTFLYARIAFILVMIVALGTRYEIRLERDTLSYSILFVTFPYYTKRVTRGEILCLTRKRVGWKEEGTKITLRKGIGIRVYGFRPHSIHEDLARFHKEPKE